MLVLIVFLTLLLLSLGGVYAVGEMAVCAFLRRNGCEPVEGPRGPLY